MDNTNKLDVLELAKQGNASAISKLINSQLNPGQIIAIVTKDRYFDREERLKIVFEYEQAKSKEKILLFTQKFFQKINPQSIAMVMIYGRKKGDDATDWRGEIKLNNIIPKDNSEKPEAISPEDLRLERKRQAILLDIKLGFLEGSEAVKLLSKAIDEFPEYYNFYYRRASEYFALGEASKALNDCCNALKIEPSFFDAHILNAKILLYLKKYDESNNLLDKLVDRLKIMDNSEWDEKVTLCSKADVVYWRALCRAKVNRLDAALEDLSTVLELNPSIELLNEVNELIDDITFFAERVKKEEEIIETISSEFELISDVGIDYSGLKNLLASQRFRQADKLTYDLMCRALGKSIGSFFTDEDFQFFPSADLLTIDKLWTVYSNGLFGLSAQLEVYQSVGRDLTVFKEEVEWKEFIFQDQNFYSDEDLLDCARKGFLPYLCSHKGKVLFISNQIILYAILKRLVEVRS